MNDVGTHNKVRAQSIGRRVVALDERQLNQVGHEAQGVVPLQRIEHYA